MAAKPAVLASGSCQAIVLHMVLFFKESLLNELGSVSNKIQQADLAGFTWNVEIAGAPTDAPRQDSSGEVAHPWVSRTLGGYGESHSTS